MLKNNCKNVLIGYFKHGKLSGIAKEIGECAGGLGFEYYGRFVDGEKLGYGEAAWSNGNGYKGNWNGPSIDGFGLYNYSNGDTY